MASNGASSGCKTEDKAKSKNETINSVSNENFESKILINGKIKAKEITPEIRAELINMGDKEWKGVTDNPYKRGLIKNDRIYFNPASLGVEIKRNPNGTISDVIFNKLPDIKGVNMAEVNKFVGSGHDYNVMFHKSDYDKKVINAGRIMYGYKSYINMKNGDIKTFFDYMKVYPGLHGSTLMENFIKARIEYKLLEAEMKHRK